MAGRLAVNLRTRIARDAFTTFLIAAALPLLVAGLVVEPLAHSRLTRQAQLRLQGAAEAYGLAVFSRLELAERSLTLAPAAAGRPAVTDPIDAFITVVTERTGGATNPRDDALAAPVLEEARRRLAASSTPLIVMEVVGRPAGNILLAARRPNGVAYGVLRPDYLWGDPEHFPAGLGFCVRFASGHQVCHSRPTDELDAQPTLRGHRDLFLRAAFGADNWRIEARQARSEALASLHVLRLGWLIAFVTCFALGVLLSLMRIRRRHAPLEQLMAATERIEHGVLDQPAAIASGDEYAIVGGALDRAALALRDQLRLQGIRARLDRAIVRAEPLESTFADLLPEIGGLIGCEGALAILIQPDGRSARLFLSTGDAMSIGGEVVIEAVEPLRRAVAAGVLESTSHADSRLLQPVWRAGYRRAALWPIQSEEGLAGALGVTCTGCLTATSQEAGRRLADHLAIAVSDMRRREELVHRAHHDDLTGLPNRTLLLERLQFECRRAALAGTRLAALFVDLDRFKLLNDSLGHGAGDAMLRALAGRLVDLLPHDGTVARLGGDEFMLVIEIRSADDAARFATRVMSAISAPVTVLGSSFICSASIGIAVFPDDGDDAATLMRNADTAMYRGKARARGSVVFFEDSMNAALQRRVYLERELRAALRGRQIWPAFQPKTELRSGRLCGAEALARWTHPEQGPISPGEFVPVAEEAGLMPELGWLMLESCCEQIARWRDAGIDVVPVAVNVSMVQLTDNGFASRVLDTLARFDLPPHCLGIEVTESMLIQQLDVVLLQLERLRDAGIEIGIDDFGTGYSSLAALRRLPADVLKIDQSFVRDMAASADGLVLVETIMAMARALGHTVVAEGVETPEQLAILDEMGCHQAQGWLIAPPLPAAEFAELLVPARELRSAAIAAA